MFDDFVSHVVEGRFQYDTLGVVNVAFIDNRDHVETDTGAYANNKKVKSWRFVSIEQQINYTT